MILQSVWCDCLYLLNNVPGKARYVRVSEALNHIDGKHCAERGTKKEAASFFEKSQ